MPEPWPNRSGDHCHESLQLDHKEWRNASRASLPRLLKAMFDIRLATEDDIEESAHVLAAAYTEDEQDLYLFPRLQDFPDRYVNTKKSILRQAFSDSTCFTYVATEMVEPDKPPKIVGVCIWYRDDEGAIEPRKTWLAKSIQSTRSMGSLKLHTLA